MKQINGLLRRPEIGLGIHRVTLTQDLKMQMWTGRAAAGTHQGDTLAFLYTIAHLDQHRIGMGVTRGNTVTMVDFNHQTITIFQAGMANYTAAHGFNTGTQTTGDIASEDVGAEITREI